MSVVKIRPDFVPKGSPMYFPAHEVGILPLIGGISYCPMNLELASGRIPDQWQLSSVLLDHPPTVTIQCRRSCDVCKRKKAERKSIVPPAGVEL